MAELGRVAVAFHCGQPRRVPFIPSLAFNTELTRRFPRCQWTLESDGSVLYERL